MTESTAPVVVHTSWRYIEAAQLRSELRGAGIPCEMLGTHHSSMIPGGGGPALAIRLIVPPSKAEEAWEYIRNRGRVQVVGPAEPSQETLWPCPNCGVAFLPGGERCGHCGFHYVLADPQKPRVRVLELHPDAQSYCPACRELSVVPEGRCKACDGDFLELVREDDLLCGNRRHLVDRQKAEQGFLACVPCETVWVLP
ncbi:MAG: hypothetical protein ABII00_18690 [Elusimicrobiota bacterium]